MRIIVLTLFLLVLLSSIWVSLGSESNIVIEWLSYHIEISTIFATAALLLVLIASFLVIYFLIFLKNIPSSLKKHYQDKQNHEDLLLLLSGFSNLYSNDLTSIKQNLKKINNNCNHPQMQNLKPLVSLLRTEYNKIICSETLEDSYQELLQYDAYKIIGLNGLIALRMTKKCYHDALVYAEKSLAIQPKSSWLLNCLIEIYTELDLYDKAEQMIYKASGYKFINRKESNVLLINNFIHHAHYLIANSQGSKAIALLEKALKIDPSYYEAVAILVRLYVQDQHKKQAYKTIEKAWKASPSMMMARLMLSISQDEALNKRIQLLENLIEAKPESKEGYLVLAEVYIAEDMLTQGRAVMDQLLALHAPDSHTCKLMALIEAKSHNNHSVIVNWLHRL